MHGWLEFEFMPLGMLERVNALAQRMLSKTSTPKQTNVSSMPRTVAKIGTETPSP